MPVYSAPVSSLPPNVILVLFALSPGTEPLASSVQKQKPTNHLERIINGTQWYLLMYEPWHILCCRLMNPLSTIYYKTIVNLWIEIINNIRCMRVIHTFDEHCGYLISKHYDIVMTLYFIFKCMTTTTIIIHNGLHYTIEVILNVIVAWYLFVAVMYACMYVSFVLYIILSGDQSRCLASQPRPPGP